MSVVPDTAAIKEDLKLLFGHLPGDGKIVIASYGENPSTGKNLPPRTLHYSPSQYEQAAEVFAALSAEAHRNAYVSLALMRNDLAQGKKGGESEVVGVVGLVADFDAKNDAEASSWQARLPMQPSMVLETSALPAPSYQCRFLFKEPITLDVAKKLATRLVQFSGCDPVSKDMSHVWRCAGGLNKPNRGKVKAGRPLEPQMVRIVQPFTGYIDPLELEKALQAVPAEEPVLVAEVPRLDSPFDNILKKHWPLTSLQMDFLKKLAAVKWADINKQITPKGCNLSDALELQAQFCVNSPKDVTKDENGNTMRSDVTYSSSEPMVAFAGGALRESADVVDICGILSNPDLLISQHVYKGKDNEDRLTRVVRAIAKAICTQHDLGTRLVELPGIFPYSEDHLAAVFAQKCDGRFVYCNEWGQWLKYDGKKWDKDTLSAVLETVRQICREASFYANNTPRRAIASAKTISAVEKISRSDPIFSRKITMFDANAYMLNTPGGLVDLHTGKVLPHAPEYYCSKMASIEIAPEGAQPTKWLIFLNDIVAGDSDYIAYMKRMCGYILTGESFEQVFFFAWGTGGNGKSVFVNILRYIMEDYATSTPMETITAGPHDRHPTDLADLRGARLVTVQETEQGRRLAESKIKMMTGGDEIKARFMRQDFFAYKPQFKLLVAGNHRPKLSKVDEAIKRRIHLLPFEVKISEDKRDRHLEEKLKSEASAILRWMVEGCSEWMKDGLNPPKKVKEATEEYFDSEDDIGLWLAECAQPLTEGRETKANLYDSFCVWCKENNEPAKTKRQFIEVLEEYGYVSAKSNGERLMRGIKLNAGEQEKIANYRRKQGFITYTGSADDLPFK